MTNPEIPLEEVCELNDRTDGEGVRNTMQTQEEADDAMTRREGLAGAAADAAIAALDRTAGPTSTSVPPQQPPPMMTEWNEAAMRWESRSMCVTTSAGTKMMGMCGPVWVCARDRMTVIHGVVAWEPISPQATRPGEAE